MRIVGLDLSLTATGVAVLDPIGVRETCEQHTLTSKGRKDADLEDRCQRLALIDERIHELAIPADLVVVEGPSFGQARQGGQHDRAGLWWQVVARCLNDGVMVVEVPPSLVKKYATGKGNAGKDEVLAAVVRRYSDCPTANNNEADALVLAAMGARHLGHPIEESLPAVHLAAMDKVQWPAVLVGGRQP